MGFALAAILAAVLVGAMSPGPSFLFVTRTALRSRAAGIAAAAGMGVGAMAYSVLALVGLRGLLEAVPALYLALRVAGGLYLIFVAVRLWRGAGEPEVTATPRGSPFLWALGRQLSNPKTALVYGGIFAALLPSPAPAWAPALPLLIFPVEAGWYTVVALAFSGARPRRTYLRLKRVVDRVAGGVLGTLGAVLAFRRPA
ncbi:MAG: LysE family translocator [Thermoplasmatota archaeon]